MIRFLKVSVSGHEDVRRVITDIVLPEDLEIPFRVLQVKVVDLSASAITARIPVGNHYHTCESGRYEFFVAVGKAGVLLFSFRYRNRLGGEILEQEMAAGDACLVPPEHPHSFVGLTAGAKLWGFANMAYDAAHDIPDKLF